MDPSIRHGMLLELLGAGMSIEEILEDYPDLEREDPLAVFAIAARLSSPTRLIEILPSVHSTLEGCQKLAPGFLPRVRRSV
ncbi:DUF433 domain-containing protein [Fimbriimonas ginsengisoli]|uniref:DUF433 domain-containing protein n=1 Tax=Fimbriimonas ginsengisoli Gsoil 348 TaxID=661478 RepID=A0A068NL45_FIMGI|nr:hypothetical protein OP10G_0828 [Fimbriimonas ginsengisoli Gsoil 348]